ncbi:MAG: hypothetical protein LBD58_00875 [Treponema sp.]|jgi:hypothetical protein|nr:hypothetical protein [Treponema sp.]
MGVDWYPRSRDAQIHLTDTWIEVFKTKATKWNIPPANVNNLIAANSAAKEKLAVVKSGERTSASVVECNEIFAELEAEARFLKKHYLLQPPLDLADLAALLLPLPDEIRTPVGKPAGQPALTLTYPGGPHMLQAHLASLAGTEPLDSRGDYGYALYKGIMPQGGATLEQAAGIKHYLMKKPLSGDELLHFRFTRRKTELVEFDATESGMTAFFCARYENQKGDHGTWGPCASAVIP